MKDNDSRTLLLSVGGDGAPAPVTPEELNEFKSDLAHLWDTANAEVGDRRYLSNRIRFCVWEGQAPDGRKHREYNDGVEPFPFEGASDGRIRLADQLVQERVLILMAAAMRGIANLNVKGVEIRDESFARRMTTLLRWVIRNKLGAQFVREIGKLAQYQEGDAPGAGLMYVRWNQETTLQMQPLDPQRLADELTQRGIDPAAMERIAYAFLDPAQEETAAGLLTDLFPHLRAKRARQMVRELRKSGQTLMPSPVVTTNLPEVRALRLMDDVMFSTMIGDLQRVPSLYLTEWLTEVELRQRVLADGWSESFVEGVLAHEGVPTVPLIGYDEPDKTGDYSQQYTSSNTPDSRKGFYQVATRFWRATNEDGIPGLYYVPFHKDVDECAHDRRLVDFQHGKLPFVFFSCEILGDRLWDSRGVPERAMSDQQTMKLLHDSRNDNVVIGTLPPVVGTKRAGNAKLLIRPLAYIEKDRNAELDFMHPPAYPVANDREQAMLWQRIDGYWGRMSETVPPMLQQLHTQTLVDLFMGNLKEVLRQILSLCQQYMTDEELQRVTGDNGETVIKSRQDIAGDFDLEISFNASDLNLDYLKVVVELCVQMLSIDSLNVIQRDKLLQRLFSAIAPDIAAEVVRPAGAAQEAEMSEEDQNMAKMRAGVEPPMQADGQNFGARLERIKQSIQKNPNMLKEWPETSLAILKARIEHLGNQVKQQENAVIGRQVGKPALGGN